MSTNCICQGPEHTPSPVPPDVSLSWLGERVSSLDESCEKPQQGSPSSSKLHFSPGSDTPHPCPAFGPAEPITTLTPTASHPVSLATSRACSGDWEQLGRCQPWSASPAWPSSPHWGLRNGLVGEGGAAHHPGNPMVPALCLQFHMPRGAGMERCRRWFFVAALSGIHMAILEAR